MPKKKSSKPSPAKATNGGPLGFEAKLWAAAAEVLSERNRELLRILAEEQPESVRELAVLTGRAESNLSRTLKTLAGYGFVRLERKHKSVRPVARPMEFAIRVM